MSQQDSKALQQRLVDQGTITDTQRQEILREASSMGKNFNDVLIAKGIATEMDIVKAISKEVGIAYVDLSFYEIDPEAVKLIPSEFANKEQVIPLFKIENDLEVALVDPMNMGLVDRINNVTGGMRIRAVVSSPSGIRHSIDQFYGNNPNKPKQEQRTSSSIASQEAPVAQAQGGVQNMVDAIIKEALDSGASDIHIEPQEKGICYRLRIDGSLGVEKQLPADMQAAIVSCIKIMANMNISETRSPQDGRLEISIGGRKIDLRIATFPTIYGEHVCARILDKSKGILTLEQLGMSSSCQKTLNELITQPFGILLVTGPTGSGKSTSLYSMLSVINDVDKNIMTLEDPVEYTIPRVHQAQINPRAGVTFAVGLRAILRMDPDVILIGEIRDKETAEISVHASLTGHLVFSSLHTNNAPAAIARLVNIGVEPYLVASSVIGVLAQKLIRKLCMSCRKERPITDSEKSIVSQIVTDQAIASHVFDPGGCPKCRNTGFKGRVGIYELLVPNTQIKEMIVKKAAADQIAAEAARHGMKSMRYDGIMKFLQGVTTLSDVLSETEDRG